MKRVPRVQGHKDFPVRRDAEGRWLCRVCGIPLSRGNQFCSKACRGRMLFCLQIARQRTVVFWRDQGVCVRCGTDTKLLRKTHSLEDLRALGWDRPERTLWELDHIEPIVDGGAVHDLGNMRTLCVPCHKIYTKIAQKTRAGLKLLEKLPQE